MSMLHKQTKSEYISVIFDIELQTDLRNKRLEEAAAISKEKGILCIVLWRLFFSNFQFGRRKFDHNPLVILLLKIQFLSAICLQKYIYCPTIGHGGGSVTV